VDFRQTYDSVKREALWKHLEIFGIPAKLRALIQICIETARCKVRFGQIHSEEFKTTVELKQDDALSHILFNITLEVVARSIHNKYKEIDVGKSVSILTYADDIVILGETEDDIKLATEELIRSTKTIRFEINENKTKYRCVTRKQPQIHQTRIIQIGEYTFEIVHSFKYLGTELNNQNNNHEEIKKRILVGNKCLNALSKCLRSKLLSKKSKMGLYKVIARPIIMYACETWPTTLEDEKKLAIVERKFLR